MTEWIKEYDERQKETRNQIIACDAWHHTSIAEMETLGTMGFCPKCKLPITEIADRAHNRMLEALVEASMDARHQAITTWEYAPKTKIPLDGSGFTVIRVGQAVVRVLI